MLILTLKNNFGYFSQTSIKLLFEEMIDQSVVSDEVSLNFETFGCRIEWTSFSGFVVLSSFAGITTQITGIYPGYIPVIGFTGIYPVI